MAAGATPVQSIDRVLDIIEALSNEVRGMALTDLATAVHLHTSTTHRLLSTLVTRGYVQKDVETGKYRLTMRLFEVSSRVMGGMNLMSVARPFLERLADETRETVHLVTRHRDEVVYLYKEDSNNSVVCMTSYVGMRNPMYCTGVGKCILAHLPQNIVKGIWDRTNVTKYTANTIVCYEDLLAELEQIRQQGYGIDNEEHEPSVVCVAAPIFDFSGSPVGALSVSAPAFRMTAEKRLHVAQHVMDSGKTISNLLGAPPQIEHQFQSV